jgi:hypothetical protein
VAVVGDARRVTLIFALLLSAALAANAVLRPQWDWDVLAYAGCAEAVRGGDRNEIHAAAYGALEAQAPAEVVRDLRGESTAERAEGGPAVRDYRVRMATDARAFEAQLPFYRGRVVFIGLLALASLIGIGVLHAAFAISLLSGLAFALILLRWTTRCLPVPVAIPATLACVLMTGVPQVMSMGTPDMLAASLVLGGAYLLAESPRRALATGLLVLAVATRVNHINLIAALIFWSTLRLNSTGRRAFRAVDGPFILLIATALACTKWLDTYGHWTVFHHTFVEYTAFPALETPAKDVALMRGRVLQSLPMFKAWQPLVFTLCGLAAIVVGFRSRSWSSGPARLAAFVLIAIAVNFALFPALWPRLMVAPWTLLWVALLYAWREHKRAVPDVEPVTAA